jgi:hypothetical protein
MMSKFFHRLPLPLLAAAFTVLLAAGTSAAADPLPDGREYWGGRSAAAGTLYCYIHRDGRHWAMTMYCPDKTLSSDGVEVARCGDFIELEFHGIHDRLYKDKLLTLSKSGSWTQLAKGNWGDPRLLGEPLGDSAPSMIPRKLESAPGDPIPLPAPSPVLEQPQLVPPTGNPILVPGPAPAPRLPSVGLPPVERVHWCGQDHAGAFFSIQRAGRYWNRLMASQRESVYNLGTEVRRCEDFIELKFEFSPERLRLYKDKLLTLSASGTWTELAKGQWSAPTSPMPMMVPAPKPAPALGDPVKD